LSTDGWIGRALRRREDPPLLQGQGRYAGDNNPPGTVHIAVRRAGVPRAGGLTVDVSAALAMPGVIGAWSAGQIGLADDYMPNPTPRPQPIRRPVLARGEVRFEGDAVAVVAAETDYQAHDAVDAIEVELNAVADEAEALPSRTHSIGEAAPAFEHAPVRVRERMRMGRICGAAIEPRAAFADWDDAKQVLVVKASVGGVFVLRDTVARCLGLEPAQVIALAEDVGGSFGAKNHTYPEYILAAAISRLLKRPVRWVATRSEDGHTTGQAHAAELDFEIASDQDGRLLGLRGKVEWPIGAYFGIGAFQDGSISSHTMSAYRLPALEIEVQPRYSDSPPVAYIRGGGRPVGNFVIERMMDRLARRLGLDPIDVRRRNLILPSEMPYTTGLGPIIYDGGDYPRLLELAVERIGVAAVRERQRAGEPVGVGVAMCVESTGIGQAEPSRVAVLPDGTARVFVGSTPQGQGHQTFVAQVVADRLGWPIERVEVRAGDSRDVANSMVTAGSRSALEVGNSVSMAAVAARKALLEKASERLEATGTWDSKGRPAWASSCHAALVRIDVDTGGVDVLRYVIAHDSGRAINPLTLEGQLHGGYAHGLGYALFEEALYSQDGNFQSSSFLDYTIVSAPEIRAEPELIHTETASTQNPEGFRGVGEAGTIAVPAAIANAIEDALYATGHAVAVDEVPVTPMRLWQLIHSQVASSSR
jgi:aerobic carbon-monoxide dehydrogenase large subunit